MALFIRQDENRSKLQERLASELQDRLKKQPDFTDSPDGVEDSQYIKNTKQSTGLLGVWLAIGVAAVVIVLWLAVATL
jgi:hypothetical protein